MTPAQSRMLAFIDGYQAGHHGASPSFGEMATGLGFSSKSGVHRVLGQLVAAGAIERGIGRTRDTRIVRDSDPLRAASDAALMAEVRRRNLAMPAQPGRVQISEAQA